jgi:hypothetical protein
VKAEVSPPAMKSPSSSLDLAAGVWMLGLGAYLVYTAWTNRRFRGFRGAEINQRVGRIIGFVSGIGSMGVGVYLLLAVLRRSP